jgi:hypothetical protein|tara:strand:+ start:947 stop:1360 length:414 start_codon:yes stop_codon:yes gene_type:complete
MAVTVKCDQYATVVLSGDDEIKYLNVKGSTGNDLSAYDVTNTKYQVPVGKRLLLTSMYMASSGTSGDVEFRFYFGPTVDSVAGATEWIDDAIRYDTGSNNNFLFNVPIFVSIPAGNYVTVNFSQDGVVGFMGTLTDA